MIANKVAFITGAARGQGRSHAVRFAREGADVILTDACEPMTGAAAHGATRADLEETVRLVEAAGGRVVWGVIDVRDRDNSRRFLDAAVADLGRLDIVVANAGIFGFGTTAEMPDETWDTMVDVNLTGVFTTCRAAVPHLEATGGGAIVLTSSVAGLKGAPGCVHYTTVKHGLVGMVKTMALELGPRGIRVNSVHPTTVGNDMVFNETLYRRFQPDLESPDREDFEVASRGLHPLGVPWVEESDVTEAVLFLVGDSGRYVTGVALPIDAGASLH